MEVWTKFKPVSVQKPLKPLFLLCLWKAAENLLGTLWKAECKLIGAMTD